MFLGAPACFISQARPVKIAFKQLFYAIGEPPGLFLSLLPAPQQCIMSCDYNSCLRSIYGDDVGEYNELLPGSGSSGGKVEGEFGVDHDDYDEEEEEDDDIYEEDEDEDEDDEDDEDDDEYDEDEDY